MSDCIRRGNCLIIDDNRVLVEYTQNRFLSFEPEAAALFIKKVSQCLSLRGVYKSIGGMTFELDSNGKIESVY